jgi:purine-binding chemotaxis protein CheW
VEQKRARHETDGELNQLISFEVGDEEYGLEILRVKEVIRVREITRLPKAPRFVKGIINLRGDVIPIIDLRDRFGLEHAEYTAMTRVIVVDVEDKLVGMVVDALPGRAHPGDQIEPPRIGGCPQNTFGAWAS